MKIRSLLIIAVILTQIPSVYADEEYHHILTLESPTPIQDGRFGEAIALSGNRLIVGETGAQVDDIDGAGRAYLYDTEWNLIATLTPNTPSTGGNFSRSLDIKDDIVVVGSHRTDIGKLYEAGEVQVYDSQGTPLYTLQSNQPTLKVRFGRELAIGNGVILIGHARIHECAGTVAVFGLEQNYLTTLIGESTLSLAGEELAANDEFILIGGTHVYGSVAVYDYNWNHVKTLQSPISGAKATTHYGECIAISEDHLVVGEPLATVNEHENAGRAYVYDTDWNLLSTLESPSPEADAEFGVDVCIAGDLVVVGEAKGDVTNGNEGKVYVFDLGGNLLDTVVSPEPETGAQFGFNVLTDGELLVVSEANAAVGEFTGAGKIHVFQLGEYKQAVFELSNLIIEPDSVDVGKPITVTVDVKNIGSMSGTHSVELMIDGDLVEEKTVTVDVGLSETVTFTYQTDVEGSYQVEIGDLSDSFEVKKPIIPGFPAVALILGLSLIMILLSQRKR